jgi:transposase
MCRANVKGAIHMAREILPDELWKEIEPLIPPDKPRRFRYPGRRPLDHRKVLTGILFVLKTGIPWEDLPNEMGCGCGMTCWNHLWEWQQAGVWQRVHELFLAKLREADKIDWSRAIVDSASVRAVFGGAKPGRTLQTEPKRAVSTTLSRTPKVFLSPRL